MINVNNYWVLNPVHYGSSQSAGYPGSSTSVLANRLANADVLPGDAGGRTIRQRDDADDPAEGRHRGHHRGLLRVGPRWDRVLILFAGHAVEIEKEAYLIPYEGNKDEAKTLSLSGSTTNSPSPRREDSRDRRLPQSAGARLRAARHRRHERGLRRQAAEPPPGVQVWSACVKDQQSLEFDGGSFFLQCLSNAMQERLGGFADPNESIPVETLFTKVNQRMKDLLSQTKFEQASR